MLNFPNNAAFRMSHAFVPNLVAKNSGDIVIVGSRADVVRLACDPRDAAPKHALKTIRYTARRRTAKPGVVARGPLVSAGPSEQPEAKMDQVLAKVCLLQPKKAANRVQFTPSTSRGISIRDLAIPPQRLDI